MQVHIFERLVLSVSKRRFGSGSTSFRARGLETV